ncbi:MAG: hypothetical protein HY906_14790 [Deltaproteobacteria bacterium]|nr:hypothetical protein [Deltaproteobacteria bacterium]
MGARTAVLGELALAVAGLTLVALAPSAGAQRPPDQVLLEYVHRLPHRDPRGQPLPWRRLLVLHRDGYFELLGRQGELEATRLGALAQLVARAQLQLGPAAACTEPTDELYRLTTTRGTLEWKVPCSAPPDATVRALLEAVQAELTGALDQPPITAERRHVGADGATVSAIVIESTGAWHRGGKHGVLTAAERTELGRAIAAARFAAAADCVDDGQAPPLQLWAWPRVARYGANCATRLDAGSQRLAALLERLTRRDQPVLAAVEWRRGQTDFVPQAMLFADGQFVVRDVVGQLAPADLAGWRQAVGKARLRLVPAQGGGGACISPPPTVFRLRTPRGEIRHRACENPPHPSVEQIEERLAALRGRSPKRERLLVVETRPGSGQRQEIVVFTDGTLWAEGRRGTVHPSNVGSLAGQIMAARLVAKARAACAATGGTQHLVGSPIQGYLAWSSPCEEADPSVAGLVQRALALRAAAFAGR